MNIGPLIIEFATLLHDYTYIWFVAFLKSSSEGPYWKILYFCTLNPYRVCLIKRHFVN